MGRIKSTLIKRTAHQLLKGENQFTSEFETNKKILGNTMPSKKTRNRIAGYIAILKQAEKAPKKVKKQPVEEEVPQYEQY